MQAAVYNELEDKVRMVLLKMTNNFPSFCFKLTTRCFRLKYAPPHPSVSVSEMLKKVIRKDWSSNFLQKSFIPKKERYFAYAFSSKTLEINLDNVLYWLTERSC